MDLEQTRTYLSEVETSLVKSEVQRESKLEEVAAVNKLLLDLSETSDLAGKAEQVLLQVSSKVLGQSTKTIDKLVTIGLQIVFEGQNLEFRTKVDKYRGKTSVKFELYENGKTSPLLDSYGGGVLVLAGVLLRTVTILTLGLRRVILLDESLSHLSDQYIVNASKLLKKLCAELDFNILMVTHQPEFAHHADRHYTAKSKNGSTRFVEDVKKTI